MAPFCPWRSFRFNLFSAHWVCFRCVHVLIIELKALFIVISPLKAASCLFILSHFILRRQQEYIHQKMTLPSSLLPTSSSARRTYCIAPLFFSFFSVRLHCFSTVLTKALQLWKEELCLLNLEVEFCLAWRDVQRHAGVFTIPLEHCTVCFREAKKENDLAVPQMRLYSALSLLVFFFFLCLVFALTYSSSFLSSSSTVSSTTALLFSIHPQRPHELSS